MLKVYSKKVISTIVASSLALGLGNAVVSAAPKNDTKQTGRTDQNVQTGVISSDEVTVARYATEITLTGTVVIDGPQLVVNIPGSQGTNVTKVGDNTWRYEATIDVSSMKGDTKFEISAYTIYKNGQHAGSIHTSAPKETQTIHVPYVMSTVAENTKWTDYNRLTNQFTLSYNEVQNWSVGDPVITAKTMDVDGVESKVTVLGTTLDVPIAIQHFKFSQNDPTWKFDSNKKTYSATFDIFISDSKGNILNDKVTITGLTPGKENTVSHSVSDDFGKITEDHTIIAPKAPDVQVVPVELNNLQLTLEEQNKNQFKVYASYTVVYSDNSTKTVSSEQLPGTLAKPDTQNQNSSSQEFRIGGIDYIVTVTYDPTSKTYQTKAVLK